MPSTAALRRRAAPLLVAAGVAAFGVGAIGVAGLDADLAAAARPVSAAPELPPDSDCPAPRDEAPPEEL
jgi:hypothetical protein